MSDSVSLMPSSWKDDIVLPIPITEKIPEYESMGKAVRDIPIEYILKSELTLEADIRRRDGGKFDRTYGLLKILLWDEYQRSIDMDEPMILDNVWGTVASKKWWDSNIVRDPMVLAWLITPPIDEILLKKEMIMLGINKLREVLEYPITKTVFKKYKDENGDIQFLKEEEIDIPLVKEIHSIVKTLQDRVHGAITQRHEIKQQSMSLNLSASTNTTQPQGSSVSLDELDKYAEKLRNIQSSIKGLVEKE